MAKPSKKWSSEVIIKFLEAYEQHPCLWNYRISSYKDKNQREEALKRIVEVMSDSVFGFDEVAAKAKIRSIRNAYALERHKVLNSYKNGAGAIYKPTVAWFSVANRFLNGVVETRDAKSTLVCLIFGIAGACRRQELRNIKIDNIEDRNNILLVKIPDSKTGKPRTFTITDEIYEGISALKIYRKYLSLRPAYVTDKTFFINYRDGRCYNQVVGIHTFAKIPRIIAKYLNLSDTNNYTGHCFRRTSDSLLPNAGADVLTLKRHEGWRSPTIAEGYVEDELKIDNEILNDDTSTDNKEWGELQGDVEESEESEEHEISFYDFYRADAEESSVDGRSAPSTSNHSTPTVQKTTTKKQSMSIKEEPAYKKTKFVDVDTVNPLPEAAQQTDLTSDEFEAFAKVVVAHLRQLPLNSALESQSDILHYLVQKRLGRRASFSPREYS